MATTITEATTTKIFIIGIAISLFLYCFVLRYKARVVHVAMDQVKLKNSDRNAEEEISNDAVLEETEHQLEDENVNKESDTELEFSNKGEQVGENTFRIKSEKLTDDAYKYKVYKAAERLKYGDVMRIMRENKIFRQQFIETLKQSKFKAYFFETPPVNVKTFETLDFEFVLVNSPRLAQVKANAHAFAEHFSNSEYNVAFKNLGKDAVLVVPCPIGKDLDYYVHLATFIRFGNDLQVDHFWTLVAAEMTERVNSQRERYTWLSTSGLGVYWLHVRLDSRPKYYTYSPYISAPSN